MQTARILHLDMQLISGVSDSPDQTVIEAFEESGGEPVRIRVQPDVRRRPENRTTFLAWRDVHWMVQVDTLEEAQLFREALSAFFTRIQQPGGIQALRDHLQSPAAAPTLNG